MPKTPVKRPRSGSRAKGSKNRPNGHVLTAKHVRPRDYKTIHETPHGVRQAVLHGLLSAATEFAKDWGPDWHKHVAARNIEIVVRSDGLPRGQ